MPSEQSSRAPDDDGTAFVDEHARFVEAIERSLRLLAVPAADAFLGRKTQDPFPKE